MLNIYLTPASISYLIQSILALVITGYLLYRAGATSTRVSRVQISLLSGFFGMIALLSVLLFFESALPRGLNYRALFPQTIVLALALLFILQFAYRYPTLPRLWPHRVEAYLVLALSLAYAVYEASFALHRYDLMRTGEVIWRPAEADYPMAVGFLWVLVVFLRQSWRASRQADPSAPFWRHLWQPIGRDARTARALTLVFVSPLLLVLLNILRSYYVVSSALFSALTSAGILIALTVFTVFYVNNLPETTTFTVKLAGVTLAFMLAVLGMIGWVIAPIYAEQYEPSLPAETSFRFTPNAQGGYTIQRLPLAFETQMGENLNLVENYEREGTSLAFRFLIYGQEYDTLYINMDGWIRAENARYSYLNYRYGGSAAGIFPLFMDLAPTTDGSNLYLRQDSDRLVLTWYRLGSFFYPADSYTFQVVLYSNGIFELHYQDLPDPRGMSYRSDAEPGSTPWFFGVVPGDLSLNPQYVNFSGAMPIEGGPGGMIQDYQLEFRQYLHEMLAPLAGVVVGSSLLLLVFAPLFLSANLVRPLRALQEGVRQMDAHQDVQVEEIYPDEIGFLTRAFNKMAVEQRTLVTTLETRVAERTQALTDAKDAAESANQAKSTFLAKMSHELRTPLTAVLGFSERMLQDASLNPAQIENLSTIYRSSENLLALINDILEISKIESGRVDVKPHAFDLHYMLLSMEEIFHLSAQEKGLALRLEYAPDVPQFIQTDQTKLRQVLLNLLSNAVKYTEQGSVTLTAGLVQPTPNPQGVINPAPHLRFAVSDTGVGIAAQDQERIFDAFVQVGSAPATQSGTGLGLTISRQYVSLLGGELQIESQPGRGSTFSFEIPVTVVAPLPDAQPARRVTGLEPGQPAYRLLVVEDTEPNRLLLLEMLQMVGFEARAAVNGQEALEIWSSWKPHLVFMDLRMPVLDGYEATRRIKESAETQPTVVIVTTASAFEEDRTEIMALGADEFISKPFRQEQVFQALQAHLGVRFTYRSTTPQRLLPARPSPESQQQAAALPEEWRQQMRQATVDGDVIAIETLIAGIEASLPDLARLLRQWAYDFDYGRIRAYMDSSSHSL